VTADIYNAAAILHDGKWVETYRKHYLPNYGVFDENRYFREGRENLVCDLGGAVFGVNICEDIWYPGIPCAPRRFGRRADRYQHLLLALPCGEEGIPPENAFHAGLGLRGHRGLCEPGGGQDELVFDGGSMVLNQRGNPSPWGSLLRRICSSWIWTWKRSSCTGSTIPGPQGKPGKPRR